MLENLLTQLEQNDPALTELDLGSINLNSITWARSENVTFFLNLSKALKNNQHLTKLRLTNKSYNVRGKNLKRILEALQANTCLTELDLNTNDIDGEDAKAIAQLLEKNTCLTTLNLKSNAIDDAGISTIITALIKNKNTRLIRLNLYDNEIHDTGVGAIADLLKEQHSPTALDLGHNHITDQGARLIAKALETNATIEELSLYRNQIENQGAEALALAIKNNPNIPLRILDLSCNEIKVEGATAIAGMLGKNIRLEALDLYNNEIGDAGVEAIAEAMAENAESPLSILKLSYNEIGDAGAKAIARMLVVNKTLTRLYLSNNQISDEGIEAIAEAAKGHPCLKTLHMGSNEISTQGAKAIARMLGENPHLEVLTLNCQSDLSGNFNIGQEGLAAIVEALKSNQHLKKLDLGDNKLGDEDAKIIASLLAKNTPLTHVNLEYNDIGYEGLKAIAEAMENNTNVLKLNIIHRSMSVEPSPYIGNDSEGPACLLAIEKCLERNRKRQNPSIVIPEHQESEQAREKISLEIPLEHEVFSDEENSEERSVLLDTDRSDTLFDDSADISNIGTYVQTNVTMDFFTSCKKPFEQTIHQGINGYILTGSVRIVDSAKLDASINPILLDGSIDEITLQEQIKRAALAKLPIVVYFGLTSAFDANAIWDKSSEIRKTAINNFSTYREDSLCLTMATVASPLPFEEFAKKVTSTLPDSVLQRENPSVIEPGEIPKEKVSSNLAKASALVAKKNEDVSVLKEEKSTHFPWGKLALLLLAMGLGGVIGLAVTGLFLSLWTIIPAAVLLIGVGMSIKFFYDQCQPKESSPQITSDGFEPLKPVEEWEENIQPQLAPEEFNLLKTSTRIQSKIFSETTEISQADVVNIEEAKKVEQAKQIIIQKLNELVSSHQTAKLIINYQNANFEFTPEEIQECFADMKTKLAIVQEQSTGHYILQWEINTPLDKRRELIKKQFNRVKKQMREVFSSPSTMMGTFDMDRRQSLLVKLAITHCIGENIAVKHPDIRYPNSIVILSPSIEKIISEQPSNEATQNIFGKNT